MYATVSLLLSTLLNATCTHHQWPSASAAAAAWRDGALLVFGWAAGAHVLEVGCFFVLLGLINYTRCL